MHLNYNKSCSAIAEGREAGCGSSDRFDVKPDPSIDFRQVRSMQAIVNPLVAATPTPASPLVLILVGPPGSGKGTQAARIAATLQIPAISTGEMIRAEIAAASELGKLAQGVTITGGLLSDDLINRVVESRLSRPDCAAGFLLDGYPRSVGQAAYLDQLLPRLAFPAPRVLHLDVPFEPLVRRTCLRRYCPACGEIYNLASRPPRCAGVCDVDGVALRQRDDDCEATVRNRLAAYERTTAPVLAHYGAGDCRRIAGEGSPDEVFQHIVNVFSTL
jgi:adenylate kinase